MAEKKERKGAETEDREMWPLQVRLITEGSACREEKRKFLLEDNGFGQAHNSFIRGFTLSGHGR